MKARKALLTAKKPSAVVKVKVKRNIVICKQNAWVVVDIMFFILEKE